MSEEHWQQLGIALKQIHTTSVPGRLYNSLRRENYPAAGRETVMVYLARVKDEVFDDPVASQLAAFLNSKRTEILDLVGRAARLSRELQAQQPEMVICHSDIHAGNILMGDDGALYIVDWDEPLLAPKERDLMFIGGGLLASGLTPQGEEALFYPSYGPAHIHASALAYYRYERIVQDIAAYCDQLFLTKAGGEDREEALYYLKSNFFPNGTIEIAYQSDSTGQKMTFDEP